MVMIRAWKLHPIHTCSFVLYLRVMARFPVLLAASSVLSLLLVIANADYGYGPKPDINKPNSEIKEDPLPIGIEGIILCKSGSKYQPIQGNFNFLKFSVYAQNWHLMVCIYM